MKKKFLFCALAGAIGFAGAKTYEMSQESEMTSLMMQNVEALTDSESTNNDTGVSYPRMINKTDKTTSIEVQVSGNTGGADITFKRTCVTYNTYCKHTGKEGDFCYQNLNKMVTNCGDWSK